MTSSPRYRGKPLLRLLECYVLKCVDQLSNEDLTNLAAMQPKLSEIYGIKGTWDQIIAAQMDFPDEMPIMVRQIWDKNQEIAKTNGVTLSGQQFVEMFVDQNIAM